MKSKIRSLWRKESKLTAQPPVSEKFPGGCYLGFNAGIDRKSAEQLIHVMNDSIRNGYKELNLCISSSGGVLDHTYYAFNIIEALPIKIVSWNIGNVQSAANILFLCGDERYATPGSTFFFHQTSYDAPAGRITEPYLQEKLKAVRYDDNRLAEIMSAKTGKLIQDVRTWQTTELVMDAATASDHGIIHGVRSLTIPPDALFYQIIVF